MGTFLSSRQGDIFIELRQSLSDRFTLRWRRGILSRARHNRGCRGAALLRDQG